MRAVGSFQDGGLKENNPADIAQQISRQIWPSKGSPAVLISIGTGTERNPPLGQSVTRPDSSQVAPHFRNVFKDGMTRRAVHAWLSSLDGEEQWRRMMNRVDKEVKPDFIRLNVPLQGAGDEIDNVDKIEDYRNLVTLQPLTFSMVLEATSALLVSSFYLVLSCFPKRNPEGSFQCHGKIRCSPHIRSILPPLQRLQDVIPLYLTTNSETLGQFLGEEDICSGCGRYCKPVSFSVEHLSEKISIYLQIDRRRRRKISGFPATIQSFINAQNLTHVFGTPHHDCPGTQPCYTCDNIELMQESHATKRKPVKRQGLKRSYTSQV